MDYIKDTDGKDEHEGGQEKTDVEGEVARDNIKSLPHANQKYIIANSSTTLARRAQPFLFNPSTPEKDMGIRSKNPLINSGK